LTRLSLVALAFVAGTLLPPFVYAGDDPLVWGSTPDDLYRLELTEDDLPAKPGQPMMMKGYWLDGYADPARLLRVADLEKRKHPTHEVTSTADVVWWCATNLPDTARDGSANVAEAFKLQSYLGTLSITGKEEQKRAAGKIELKASFTLTNEGNPQQQMPKLVEGSKLTIERTFDEAAHAIVEAKFDLTLEVEDQKGQRTSQRHAGKIKSEGKLDLASRDFLVEVDAAIKRGAKGLRELLTTQITSFKSMKNGNGEGFNALGNVALSTFALLRSGVPADELKDAFEFMAGCEWKEVYSVSLYIMCLEARSVRRADVAPEAGGRTVSKYTKDPVPDPVKKEMNKAAQWLLAARKQGCWTYKGGDGPGAGAYLGDRSNSQFATLALHCAATSGCPIDPAVFEEIATELAGAQEADGPVESLKGIGWSPASPLAPPSEKSDGKTRSKKNATTAGDMARARGWGYMMKTVCVAGQAYGSMTGAGLSSSAIAREGLRRANVLNADLEATTRREIQDGVAWFLVNWNPSRNAKGQGGGTWFYYYLYSVEKAMELAGVETLGGRDWWREGCAQLLALESRQKPGTWGSAIQGSPNETALALLFLNRATLPVRLVITDKVKVATGTRDPDVWDQVKIEGVGYVKLHEVLEAIEEAQGEQLRDYLRYAEKGFDLVPEELRPRLVPELLRLLALPNKDVKKLAKAKLKAATGGLEDEAKLKVFCDHWQEIDKAAQENDWSAIPKVRGHLVAADSTVPLKRGALTALVRLRAVEALGDVIGELSGKDLSYRKQVFATCCQLANGEQASFDPAGKQSDRDTQQAAWKTWFETNRDGLVAPEEARRAALQLSSADGAVVEGAKAKLRSIGKRAVPALAEALDDARSKDKALALLQEITKQKLGADRAAWVAWWEKNK